MSRSNLEIILFCPYNDSTVPIFNTYEEVPMGSKIVFTYEGKKYSVPASTYQPKKSLNYIVLPDRTTIAVESWKIIPDKFIVMPPEEGDEQFSPEQIAESWLGVVAKEV
jgi:hypothetical protein